MYARCPEDFARLRRIKYHTCPLHQREAILLVDLETETHVKREQQGKRLYYCIDGPHFIAVPDLEIVR